MEGYRDPGVVTLNDEDVPQMLDLIARTEPGPFAANIKANGDNPFLHASPANVNAIRLYESMGFVLRAEMNFGVFKIL